MVGHETVSMADPVISFDDMLESIEKSFPVMVILKNGLLLITARGYMIDRTGIFYAKRARHAATIAEVYAICNKRDLTLKTPEPRVRRHASKRLDIYLMVGTGLDDHD